MISFLFWLYTLSVWFQGVSLLSFSLAYCILPHLRIPLHPLCPCNAVSPVFTVIIPLFDHERPRLSLVSYAWSSYSLPLYTDDTVFYYPLFLFSATKVATLSSFRLIILRLSFPAFSSGQ